MNITKMTMEDKIRTMEDLWDDLCRNAEKVPSPLWHKDILAQREESVSEGKIKFNDWDSEKEKIRQSLK